MVNITLLHDDLQLLFYRKKLGANHLIG